MSIIQTVVDAWLEGRPIETPMDDCQQIKTALPRATLCDRDTLMLHAPEILRTQCGEGSSAIRYETMWAIWELFRTGYRPEPQRVLDLAQTALSDSYEHVLFVLERIVKEMPWAFAHDSIQTELCDWKTQREQEFTDRGGEKQLKTLRKECRALNGELQRKIAAEEKKAESSIAEIDVERAAIVGVMLITFYPEPASRFRSTQRMDLLRTEREQLSRLIEERFPTHFSELRGRISAVEYQLERIETLRKELDRWATIFGFLN